MNIKSFFTKKPRNTQITRSKNIIKKGNLNFFQGSQKKKINYKKRSTLQLQIPKGNRKNSLYYKIGFLLLILVIMSYFIFGPVLRVENILITRKDKIVDINQSYTALNYIRGKNILLIETAEVIKRLKKNQKSIKDIKIRAKFPHSLSILIGSYDIVFQTDTHYILENGLLIEKRDIIHDSPYIVLDRSGEKFYSENNKISSKDLLSIGNIVTSLEKNIVGFTVKNIYYAIREHELMVLHENGSIFIFDILGNINEQIEKLSIYHTDNQNINTTALSYVDIRVPNKIFICPLDAEVVCNNNLSKIYGEFFFKDIMGDTSRFAQ